MRFLLKTILKVFSFTLLFCTAMGIGLMIYASTLLSELPTVAEIRHIPLNIPLRIYSADEKLIAEYGSERRIPVSLDQVPPLLIDAILATEDDRFYHHPGVDFPGLVRATISNIASQTRGQGASTITMQVARNFFLDPEKTYTRKLKEILLAFSMERVLTKDEILELYLNKIFLGHRSYGFAAAAQFYYGDALKNLSLPELAMLAGLPKAPSRDNPISNPKRAKERRGYVLKRLHELGKIDNLSYETTKNAPITARKHIADVDLQAPFISEMARQIVFDHFGDSVYELGLNITVTIDSKYQQKANQALRKGILDYDIRHGYRGVAGKIDLDSLSNRVNVATLIEILQPWPSSKELKSALVTAVNETSFFALTAQGESIEVYLDAMKWARKYIGANSLGKTPTTPSQVVSAGDVVYVKRGAQDNWMLSQMPKVSGALVSLDPKTGGILSLTGGFDFYLSKFNRATQASRQPGSNIKPFIYSAALDNGFTPASLVSAAPIVVQDSLEGVWRPQNYSKKFFGPTRLRKALSKSINLVSVRLLRAMGIDTTIKHLEKFGFDGDELPPNLSLALGSIQVTPLDLASHFAVFANGGYAISPYLIKSITNNAGKPIALPQCVDCNYKLISPEALAVKDRLTGTIKQTGKQTSVELATDNPSENIESDHAIDHAIDHDTPPPTSSPPPAISPQNAFLTTSMLKQVIRSGTGRRALSLNRNDLAGKTGTTNDFRDAWFSGFSPDVMTTVFIGFDEPSHLGRRESGASAALPIWVDYMGLVLKDFPEQPENIPENITTRFINKDTAIVTSNNDPDGFTEYFEIGSEPNNIIGASTQGTENDATNGSITESLF